MGSNLAPENQSAAAKVDLLECELSSLAYTWRSLGSQESREAAGIVQKYHAVFAELWSLGWDGEGLLPDSELPNDLMPSHCLERWNIK
jgi:hypothetical protein